MRPVPAVRLADHLKDVFGSYCSFIDFDMPVGVKFKEHLHDVLNDCGVLLAIIGPNWLNASDETGRRRLDNADDWVEGNIVLALARGITVVWIIIDDGVLPSVISREI